MKDCCIKEVRRCHIHGKEDLSLLLAYIEEQIGKDKDIELNILIHNEDKRLFENRDNMFNN